jgi:hypothetical protein
VLTFVAILALLTAGCEESEAADDGHTSQWPAGAAGVMCQLLEYDAVFDQIGVRFDTAGGATKDDTLTCALTQTDQDYPYLTLALTPAPVDPAFFTANVQPAGATVVPELGKAAYRTTVVPAAPSGPGVEVCWLSGTGRLMILKYVFPPDAAADEVTAIGPKLVTLAQKVEKALPA